MRRATSNSGRIFRETPNFYPRSPCGERPTTATTCVAIANFYPRSPCGERPAPAKTEYGNLSFLSTLSLRRATKDGLCRTTETLYFYPRSPCGERHSAVMCSALLLIFLSTLSLRRATQYWATRARAAQLFLSTLSLRRATTGGAAGNRTRITISIHALLAESDWIMANPGLGTIKFLSTLSLRRATNCARSADRA